MGPRHARHCQLARTRNGRKRPVAPTIPFLPLLSGPPAKLVLEGHKGTHENRPPYKKRNFGEIFHASAEHMEDLR